MSATFPRVLLSSALLLAGFTALSAADYRDEFHQSYSLAANGRVKVSNVNGAVRISAWDQNQVKVDAIKTARSQSALDEARVEVDSRPDAIEIRTRYPENDHHDGRDMASVEYTIYVPRAVHLDSVAVVNGALTIENVSGGVKASSVNGRVTAQHIAGQADISTVNGELNADFDRIENRVKLSSVNGRIVLAMPASVSARFKASTLHGGIESDFPVTSEGGIVGRRAEGTIGNGATEVSLQTVNGGIRVHRR